MTKLFHILHVHYLSMMMPHVRTVNEYLWERGYLGNEVVFKSSQTPLIYDPMSTIVFGYASCTGEGWLGLSSAVND